MSPSRMTLAQDFVNFPRVSGDEPEAHDGGELGARFSPRERG